MLVVQGKIAWEPENDNLLNPIQATMIARVCALYESSKSVVIFLCSSFVITQVLLLATAVQPFLPPDGQWSEEGTSFGIRFCVVVPSVFHPSLRWANPVNSAVLLVFESMLLSMLIYRTIWQIKYQHTNDVSFKITAVIKQLIRHGLFYFLW